MVKHAPVLNLVFTMANGTALHVDVIASQHIQELGARQPTVPPSHQHVAHISSTTNAPTQSQLQATVQSCVVPDLAHVPTESMSVSMEALSTQPRARVVVPVVFQVPSVRPRAAPVHL